MKHATLNSLKSICYTTTLLLFIMGCSTQEKFNAEIWQQKGLDWQMTDAREKMVEDLIQSDTLLGLTKTKVIELLGKSEKVEEQTLRYLIREKYVWNDIDPEYISYLKVKLDTNQVAVKCEIEK